MEDIERQQLIEFITQSTEALRCIYSNISDEHPLNAAFNIGRLISQHETLLQVLDEREDDCDEDQEELEIKKFLNGFKVLRKNANL